MRDEAKPLDDWDLLARLRDHDDEAAMAELVARHQQSLLNYFRRSGVQQDGEDLVQETMIRMYRHCRRIRKQAKFTTFLYTVARNVMIDHIRKRSRKQDLHERYRLEASPEDMSHPAPEAGRSMDISELLGRLPADAREAVVLIHMQGLTYPEASEVIGVPEGTVKSRVFHALKRLREMIHESAE